MPHLSINEIQQQLHLQAAAYQARPHFYASVLGINSDQIPLWIQGLDALVVLAFDTAPHALISPADIVHKVPALASAPTVLGRLLLASHSLQTAEPLFEIVLLDPDKNTILPFLAARDWVAQPEAHPQMANFLVCLQRTTFNT